MATSENPLWFMNAPGCLEGYRFCGGNWFSFKTPLYSFARNYRFFKFVGNEKHESYQFYRLWTLHVSQINWDTDHLKLQKVWQALEVPANSTNIQKDAQNVSKFLKTDFEVLGLIPTFCSWSFKSSTLIERSVDRL